ncbi:MAG: hypothetical protein ACXIUM_10610 [Wenzhouxiangella sp.]
MRKALTLALCLAPLCFGSAARADTLNLLDSPAHHHPRITNVIPEPDGGFTVVFSSGQGQTYDASGTLSRQFGSRWLAVARFDEAFRTGDRLVLVRAEGGVLTD